MTARRMPSGESVATATLAFRVWAAAEAIGWNITIADLAEQMGESVDRVRRIVQLRGWRTKFRSAQTDSPHAAMIRHVDDALEAMGAR